jgi:AcrR family transcriptional regulator
MELSDPTSVHCYNPVMPGPPSSSRAERRAQLLDIALRQLEESGPEGLQARSLTAEIGASTQAIYTLFGGMAGLFEAIVADGFVRFAQHVDAVAETEDPVADHFSRGWAYCDWALAHPQLYRLMFGLTGGGLRVLVGLEMTMAGTLANFPEGQAAIEVLVRSVNRVIESGRIRPVNSIEAAAQFLSATHGYVLLEIAGAFGQPGERPQVLGQLAVNLMVGLGDDPDAVQRSLLATITARNDMRHDPPDRPQADTAHDVTVASG